MRTIFNALIRECGYEEGKSVFEWYCKNYGVTITDDAPARVKHEVLGIPYASIEERVASVRPGDPQFFLYNKDFWGQNGQHQPGKWCVGTVCGSGAVPYSQDFDMRDEAIAWGLANLHDRILVGEKFI